MKPPPLVSHAPLTPDDAWGFTYWDRDKCAELISQYRSDGIYTPPSIEGSIRNPTFALNWGSGSFDPKRQLFITNTLEIPMFIKLIPLVNETVELNAQGDRWSSPFDRNIDQSGIAYGLEMGFLLSPFGAPCTAPPWRRLVAVDLKNDSIK